MTTFTEVITETFKVVSCYSCAARFGIQADLYRRVVTDAKGSVYCPACGKETCWIESESSKRIKDLENKLRWEADNTARQKAAKEHAEASLRTTRGIVTKLKKRSAAGVCPCCNRTFKQLANHMAQKHPDFAKSE
jgi:uncharacterized Zn finger protein (UPF0148 family)